MKCQQFSDVFEIFHFVRALLLLEKMYINLLGLNCSPFYAVENRIPRVYPWMNELFQILSQGYTT